VKLCKVVVLHYRGNGDGKISLKKIAPYGFLYGHRHYLIGAATETGRDKTYMFRLSAIEKIDITNENFERDPKFSLRDYAERSFGLWQGDVVDVVLRFTPYAADNARDFIFHPTQTQEEQPDGSLVVRFRAGSLMEMAWHLYSWGTDVEVLAPAELAEMVNGARRKWDGLP
jgi:predicted DNA-binding transcriptional regulator YafY